MLFTTYSNIKKNNFLTESIQIHPNINKDKYQITCLNSQEVDGMISIGIFNKEDEIDNNTQTQNNFEEQTTENNNENNTENNDGNNNQNNENNNDNNNLQENQIQENEEGANNNEEMDENNNINENEEQKKNTEQKENFDYIMNFSLGINTEELLIHNYQDKDHVMNGLERYGCQTIIYTPKKIFYLNSPSYCHEGYKYWNIGWVDFKNQLFYQTNYLSDNLLERVQYLSLWIDFLQTLITNQIYKNLFEYFGFEGSTLINKDRFIYEPKLKKLLIQLKFCDENDNEVFDFICSLFKSNNNMISFSLIKKKISSNLKNFFDGIINENTSASFGINSNGESREINNNSQA